ncbi:MAG: hypothetical protein AAGA47_04455 [Pseudomonadota bacterium]
MGGVRGLPPVWFMGAALVAALLILWPFTQALYLPLTDLPNHIARHAIMADAPDGPLAKFYTTQFVLVPNSAVDLLWRILGYPGDAIVFSHRVMAFAALNLAASGVVLARVIHGEWTGWSLACGLFAFNVTFLFGFQNFNFSLAFAIYAFALYLASEGWQLRWRFVMFLSITPILFLMHFFAFAILAALAFGRELQKLIEHRDRQAVMHGLAMAVPFVVPVIWLLVDMLTGPENPAGTYTDMGTFKHRLDRMITPLYSYANDLTQDLNMSGFVLVLGVYAILVTTLFKSPVQFVIAPKMRGPVLVLLSLVFLSPEWLSGVAFIGIRFGFAFLIVAIAATRAPSLSRTGATAGVLLILAAIGFRSSLLAEWFGAHDQEMRDLAVLFEENIDAQDKLIPVRAPGSYGVMRLAHAQAYASTERGAFMPTLFQGVHAVQLRPEWSDYATPLMHGNPACALFDGAADEVKSHNGEIYCRIENYVADWTQKFDYVISMEPQPQEIISDAPIELVATRGRFELYRVVN